MMTRNKVYCAQEEVEKRASGVTLEVSPASRGHVMLSSGSLDIKVTVVVLCSDSGRGLASR